jgi:predicted NUDIX family NTP pyrophosphohydrolase
VERLEDRSLLSATGLERLYDPGFAWDRTLDWQAGTVEGATDGNPSVDGQGNDAWQYARVQGDGPLGGASPWYQQAPSPLVWDGNWNADGPRWAASDNALPAVSTVGMQIDASAQAVVAWLNPTGREVALAFSGQLVVSWLTGSSGSVDVAIVRTMDASPTQYQELFAQTVTGAAGNSQTLSVSLSAVAVGPADQILVTANYRGTSGTVRLTDDGLLLAFDSYLPSGSYAAGMTWNRDADWTGGQTQGSAAGNPDGDQLGNAAWRYSYVSGGDGLGGSNPWYKQSSTLLTWDSSWFGEAGRWTKADNVLPAVSQARSETQGTSTPLVEWLNPTGQEVAVDLGGSLELDWDGGASGAVDVAVILVHTGTTTVYTQLLAQTCSGTAGTTQTIPVSATQVMVGPNDRILITHRYTGTSGRATLHDANLQLTLNTHQQDLYQWNRRVDWTPGTTVGSTTGNPDDDHWFGRAAWKYEYVTASNSEGFSGATPWYQKTSSSLVWDNSFSTQGSGWVYRANNDQGPAIFSDRLADFGTASRDRRPLVRWTNNTGRRLQLDVLGDLAVNFVNGATGEAQVAVVCHRASGTEILCAATCQPTDSPYVRADRQNVILDPGDEIVLSLLWNYGSDTASNHYVTLDDSSLALRVNPFLWDRSAEWSTGTAGSTVGNPDADSLGLAAWRYAWIGGGNNDGLDTSTPWYTKTSSLLEWSDDWRGTGQSAWVYDIGTGSNNLGPAVFQDRLVHSGEYGARRPALTWLYPVDSTRRAEIFGNLQVAWQGASGTAAGTVDVALIQQHADGTLVPLLTTTLNSTEGLSQDIAVDLRHVTFLPGDQLLLTERWDYGSDTSSTHWVSLTDGLSIQLEEVVQVSAETPEDTPLLISDLAARDGFTPATMYLEQAPTHGTSTLQPDGSILYTPAANWSGADTLVYGVNYPGFGPLWVTVSVDVQAVNDPPVLVADTGCTTIGRAVNVDVLANDADADLDLLRVTIASPPAHGRAIVESDQSVTYIPTAGYQGSDVFSYTVSDGTLEQGPANVSLTINTATRFWVSPTGNDAHDGLTPATALATLNAARLKARPLTDQAVEIVFLAGTYRFTQPAVFDSDDSGSAAYPIVYRAADRYAQDWTWNRAAEWQPGSAPGSATGNPSADAQGAATWQYAWTTGGGGLGADSPWYAQSAALMLWDDNFAGQGARWARAGDTLPAASSSVLEADGTASPVLRWLNPTGRTADLDLAGSLGVTWSTGASGIAELAVVHEKLDTAGTVTGCEELATFRLSSSAGAQIANVDLKNLNLAAGDRILIAVRYSGSGSVRVDDHLLNFRLLAATADRVVFSGAQPLAASWSEAGGGLWQANVQPFLTQFGLTAGFNTLFVDGQTAQRAREPDVGYYTIVAVDAATSLTAFQFSEGNISGTWANLTDIEVVHYQQWQAPRMRIAAVDDTTNTVTLAGQLISDRGYDWDYGGPSAGTSRYYVENFLEGLDTPGEWYLNVHTGVLYYRPLAGQDIHSVGFTVPVTEQLLHLDTTSYVGFSGLEFVETDWHIPAAGYRGFQGADAEMSTLPAVQATAGASQGLTLADNTFARIGGYGLKIASAGAQIVGNRLHDLGAGGILVPDTPLEGHRISRNEICDYGTVYADAIGIFVELAGRTRVTNNEVYQGAYSGIEVGWSWDASATDAHDNLVQENHVHHVMQRLYDGAGIYLNGYQPGTAVQANQVHDIARTADHYFDDPQLFALHGIYLDEGTSGIVVRGNTVYDAQCLVKVNHPYFSAAEPGYNQPPRIVSNILVGATRRAIELSGYPHVVLQSNVCAWTAAPAGVVGLLGEVRRVDGFRAYRCDANLYDLRLATISSDTALRAQHESGHDLHSRLGDPRFVDAAGGDYRLLPDSPAIAVGFDAPWLIANLAIDLDADGNGTADALTDGILILCYLFNPSGLWGFGDALGVGATRTTREAIQTHLDRGRTTVLDVDGNGTADALTDGILILRYLFNSVGDWSYLDALGVGATRTTREAIRAHLDQYDPRGAVSSGGVLIAAVAAIQPDVATGGPTSAETSKPGDLARVVRLPRSAETMPCVRPTETGTAAVREQDAVLQRWNLPSEQIRSSAGPTEVRRFAASCKETTMPRLSAGLLMYRFREGVLEVLLAHPGGPFFRHKDHGAWSIPKGEPDPGEDLLVTAQREFAEETSLEPSGPFLPLPPIQQKGGKIVHAWAFQGDCDPAVIRSNTFTIEWPPKSGRQAEFPEIDRAAFFDLPTARTKIKAGQEALLDELARLLG